MKRASLMGMLKRGLMVAVLTLSIVAIAAPAQERTAQANPISDRTTWSFDVASLRQSNADGPFEVTATRDGYRAINIPILRLIATAYVPTAKADPYFDYDRILGAPDWVRTDPYTLDAKVAGSDLADWQIPNSQEAMLRIMTQRLLAERCKLVLHRENRELPSFGVGNRQEWTKAERDINERSGGFESRPSRMA